MRGPGPSVLQRRQRGFAGVVELVDTQDLGSCGLCPVGVQVPPPAPSPAPCDISTEVGKRAARGMSHGTWCLDEASELRTIEMQVTETLSEGLKREIKSWCRRRARGTLSEKLVDTPEPGPDQGLPTWQGAGQPSAQALRQVGHGRGGAGGGDTSSREALTHRTSSPPTSPRSACPRTSRRERDHRRQVGPRLHHEL